MIENGSENKLMYTQIPEHAENIDTEFLKNAPHQRMYHHSISEAIKYMMDDNENIYFSCGPKGCGKTFTVLQVLEELDIKYTFHQYKNDKHIVIGDGQDLHVFDDFHYLCEDALKTGYNMKVLVYLNKALNSKRALIISEYPLSYYKLGEEYRNLIQEIERPERFLDVYPESYMEYLDIIDMYRKKLNVVVDDNCAFFIFNASHKLRFLARIINHLDGELTEKKLIDLFSNFSNVITKKFNIEDYFNSLSTKLDYNNINDNLFNINKIYNILHDNQHVLSNNKYLAEYVMVENAIKLAERIGFDEKNIENLSINNRKYRLDMWLTEKLNYYNARLPKAQRYKTIFDMNQDIRELSMHIYRMFSDKYMV